MLYDYDSEEWLNFSEEEKQRIYDSEVRWMEGLKRLRSCKPGTGYLLRAEDHAVVDAARQLLLRILHHPTHVNAGVLEVTARILGAFQRLPLKGPSMSAYLSISLPGWSDGEERSSTSLTIEIDGHIITIRIGGYYYGPYGGDSFTAASWEACLDEESSMGEDHGAYMLMDGLSPLAKTMRSLDLNNPQVSVSAMVGHEEPQATDPEMPEYLAEADDEDAEEDSHAEGSIAPPRTAVDVIPPLSEKARQLIDVFGVDWIPSDEEEDKRRK